MLSKFLQLLNTLTQSIVIPKKIQELAEIPIFNEKMIQ